MGRVAIVELLQIDDVIREMIEHDKSSMEIQRYIHSTNMINIKTDALQKLLVETTSLQEVLRIMD